MSKPDFSNDPRFNKPALDWSQKEFRDFVTKMYGHIVEGEK